MCWVVGGLFILLMGWGLRRRRVLKPPFYTFAREIGHNLDCNHAADQEAFSYAHGWRLLVETGRSTGR